MLTPEENNFIFDGEVFQDADKFLLSINNIDLSQYITKFEYDEYDVSTSDSGLDDNGSMLIDVVAKDKRKLSVVWDYCPSSYINKIKSAINSVTFNAEWVVGDDEQSVNIPSYRGDRKITMLKDANGKCRWSFSLSVIGIGGE